MVIEGSGIRIRDGGDKLKRTKTTDRGGVKVEIKDNCGGKLKTSKPIDQGDSDDDFEKRHKKRKEIEPKYESACAIDKTLLGQRGYDHQRALGEKSVEVAFDVYVM